MIGEQTDGALIIIDDEEKVTIRTKKGGKGLVQGVIFAEIVDFGIKNITSTTGLADFEAIESGGMDEADDAAMRVENGKMLKAGTVKSVKGEWSEDFVIVNVSDGALGQHDGGDLGVRKIHDRGDDMTFALAQNMTWSMTHKFEKFGGGLRDGGS